MADADQTTSDLDQTAVDIDQTHSDRDQVASDRDQHASDLDQAISDGSDDETGRERSRRARQQSSAERDSTSHARSETARIRDESALLRDQMADNRDAAAAIRDRLAASLDAEIEKLSRSDIEKDGDLLPDVDLVARAAGDRRRAAEDRERASASRERAAGHREAGAVDRDRAAADRSAAALDRDASAAEFAQEGLDHLTGALGRGMGLAAIRRELDRTTRSDEPFVVAFVDVDGLKAVNDAEGHAAGDELLCHVAKAISAKLRSYDVVARLGGDEFVCSLSGQDIDTAVERFGVISAHLADVAPGTTFTVGFAQRQAGDSVDDLIHRADTAMMDVRRPRP